MTPPASAGPSLSLKFRTISLQDALTFGGGLFFSHALLWMAAGVLMGVVHHFLLLFLRLNGGSVTLAERLLEALFLSAWPLGFSAESAALEQDGGNPSLANFFKVRKLFSLTFSMICLSFISLGGAMVLVQIGAWLFPGGVEPLNRSLLEPASASAGWSLLPLLSLGGMLAGLPYSFGPMAALHEEKGFLAALERSRWLTRDVRFSMFFLQGFLFVILCGGYFVFNAIPNAQTFTNHVLESVVIAGAASLVGTVYTHAYRQAVALDTEPVLSSVGLGGRIHIPDASFSMEDISRGSP